MNLHAIYHIPEVPYCYGTSKNTIYLKLRTANEDLKKVNLYYKEKYAWKTGFTKKEMNLEAETELFKFFGTLIDVSEGKAKYFFSVEDKNGLEIFFSERGVSKNKPDELGNFHKPYVHESEIYKPVTWAKDSIVYQIFPERFSNGNKENDPRDIEKWGSDVKPKSFFGGDLKGITNNLDYIDSLGVNLIYLTPIFKSRSNHKYNIMDYFEIDESFGTKEEFKELVEKAHSKGIRIVLDAVFNHTGDDFFAFEELKKDSNSKYKDWYYIDGDSVCQEKINYKTFGERLKYMPKLNMDNKETKEYFLEVGRYWIREFDIDGWRLDVADEVCHSFWKDFRKAVKDLKEEALIIGEVMHLGNEFLKGDEFDSTMNYPFREACLDFFAYGNISSRELIDRITLRKEGLIDSMYKEMLNLLDSHDTARFLHECKEDKRKLALAEVFKFTSEGVPYIYYGDEVGLTGGDDPDCRRCMVWEDEKIDIDLLNHYKKLTKIRKENKELIDGTTEILVSEDKVLVYKRVLGNDSIMVIINNSKKSLELDLGLRDNYKDIYNEKDIFIDEKLRINEFNFNILKL